MSNYDGFAWFWFSIWLITITILGPILDRRDEDIKHYQQALDKITNDMAINYQLQRETLKDLAQCEAVRDTLAGH